MWIFSRDCREYEERICLVILKDSTWRRKVCEVKEETELVCMLGCCAGVSCLRKNATNDRRG